MPKQNYSELPYNTEQERKSVEKVRRVMGLPEFCADFVTCLRCGSSFYSEDRKSVRICHSCKDKMANSERYKNEDDF